MMVNGLGYSLEIEIQTIVDVNGLAYSFNSEIRHHDGDTCVETTLQHHYNITITDICLHELWKMKIWQTILSHKKILVVAISPTYGRESGEWFGEGI